MTSASTAALQPPALVRLAAAGAGAVKKGRIPLPAELIICPWGESRDLAGNPVIVNETTVAELAAMQSKYGFDEVALDFGHNTTPKTDEAGNPLPPKEPLPIAGMGKLSVVIGKGIVLTPTSWTTDGEHYYTGGHYKDLSPTVGKNAKGEVNFIHSVALTRAGQIDGLHAYAADGLPTLTTLQTQATMDTTALDYRAVLLKKLNLPDTATDEEIVAASEMPAVTPLAVVPADGPALVALQARMDNMERDNLISDAVRSCKVIPLSADSLNSLPIPALKDMLSNIVPTVPLSATTPSTVVPLPTLKALSAEEETVRTRMGLTVEQWHAAQA